MAPVMVSLFDSAVVGGSGEEAIGKDGIETGFELGIDDGRDVCVGVGCDGGELTVVGVVMGVGAILMLGEGVEKIGLLVGGAWGNVGDSGGGDNGEVGGGLGARGSVTRIVKFPARSISRPDTPIVYAAPATVVHVKLAPLG
jgi:hypothetical protein